MPPLFSRNRAFPSIRALTIFISKVVQVIRKKIVYKCLFCFTLDMDQQPRHGSFLGRSPADLVLLPQLTETIVFQPSGQFRGFQSCQFRASFDAICHQDIFRSEMVKEERRLRTNNHLCLGRGLLDERSQHGDRVGVQSQLRFIDEDHGWSISVRLKKQSGQGDEP